jgi:hypothetical protein
MIGNQVFTKTKNRWIIYFVGSLIVICFLHFRIPSSGQGSTPRATTTANPILPTPVSVSNGISRITATGGEITCSLKGHSPRSGYRFVLIHLSQQNISPIVQYYTGEITLIDDNNQSYKSIKNLENFWHLVLKPDGINFGYLVYEIPVMTKPGKLVLSSVYHPPLTLNLP